MEVIKMCVVVLAVLSCFIAIVNLVLISLEFSRVYLRVTIGIYYFCTFVVLCHVIYLMKKAFTGSRFTWKLSAHILLYLLAFLICLAAIFGSDHQLKHPVSMVVLTIVHFVLLSCFNGLIFVMLSRNEEQFQEQMARSGDPDHRRSGSSRTPLPYGCYTIGLYGDDVNRGAGVSSDVQSLESAHSIPKSAVGFAKLAELVSSFTSGRPPAL